MPLLHADRERSLTKRSVIELAVPDTTGEPDLDTLIATEFPTGLSRHGHRNLWNATHDLEYIAAGRATADEVQHRVNADIDLIVELVRRDVAPHAPSRYVSLFACDSAKALRAYAAAAVFVDDYRVAVLDVDDGFRVDAAWLSQGSPLSMWHLARSYWSQQPRDDDAPRWEYLVELPVAVTDVRPR